MLMYAIELTVGELYRERLRQAESERLARKLSRRRSRSAGQQPQPLPTATAGRRQARPDVA